MKRIVPVLSVTGSDCSGNVGVQADVKTIADMGGYPLTAVTAITIQNSQSLIDISHLSAELVLKQVRTVLDDMRPAVAKVGLLGDSDVISPLRNEIISCKYIVLDPGIISSSGRRLIDNETLAAIRNYLIPETSLLMLKCKEAELILKTPILSDEDMLNAARQLHEMGAQWVLLRGGSHVRGQLTALLYGQNKKKFFTSYNTEGWRRHGVGGALSAAIATRLGFGDDMEQAISKAHEYIHSQVVYAVSAENKSLRPSDIYNQFLSLIAENYQTAHDVRFYAEKLCITPRYLCQITDKVVAKTPKQVIADYVISQAKVLLDSSRLTIQEIANKLGFSSQALFGRFFKSQEGRSPSAYRGL
ncbi:bifunctional hydroxymethylpyrimidine kinase/phosphomethylpyrimidine kinase [Prevotella sp. A2931]|uniref:hydroxymethylpyrimidine kinase n=1 Tax=Prevotella illustrans TaxID=2800387 RepID=A0ABS3M2P9_9BACT|nr:MULTISPECIES: bifunctional hydroxymethylpyrimidine kinase/phosphomethylpyrimidine kinase [Prevotella]MBO1362414.1 bifunctional hydroxymethylpyrimidine kinase/phosphomethylpyrimidine kinase [Prevotella illustrans]PTL25539.1 phosphomethylpyrimidine kinase [Prevotella sp. oral taxon 820]